MAGDVNGNDLTLSKRQVKEVMREHSPRVSDDAAIRVAYEAQRQVSKTAMAAKVVANSHGRETIKEEDVRVVQEIVEMFSDE
jgi:histone H3/H4